MPHDPLQLWTFLLLALLANSVSAWTAYDSTAYTKCTNSPKALLYDGGIVTNPDFNDGLTGWSPFGSCVLQLRRSSKGNTFVVATNRTASYNGPSQSLVNLTSGVKYSLSAWLQVNGPPETALVKATVETDGGKQYQCAGTVIAQSGCWSFLKGGFVLDSTPTISAKLYFETVNFTSGLELWLDRASVQPFQDEEWRGHQRAWKESLRRRSVRLYLVDSKQRRVHGASIQVVQAKMSFPFGSAVAQNILSNQQYQKYFLERFNTAVFENELKWYSTEQRQGLVNYNTSDKMLAFCNSSNISVRGHNIFWEDPKYQQQWVQNLGKAELQRAALGRIQSLVGRYAGRFLDWDVMNEQLHFSFYEDKLGPNASVLFFQAVQQLDPATPLFLNDYNVIENANDPMSTTDAYLQKVRQLRAAGVTAKLGVGLEAHFTQPNVAYMRGVLDKLGKLGLPVWLTEADINVAALGNNVTKAAAFLEEVLREGFCHPAVAGIALWTAWHPNGCYRMCLTDNNMTNLATGDVVDALLREWRAVDLASQDNGAAGVLTWRGPVGQHKVAVRWRNASFAATIEVSRGNGMQRVLVQLPDNATASQPLRLLQLGSEFHPPIRSQFPTDPATMHRFTANVL